MNKSVNPEYESFVRSAVTQERWELEVVSTKRRESEAEDRGCKGFLLLSWGPQA